MSENEIVAIFRAKTAEEAQVIRATLESEGIVTFDASPDMSHWAGFDSQSLEGVADGIILVSASDVEAARRLLEAPPLTEEELILAEESDATTLADAEAKTHDA